MNSREQGEVLTIHVLHFGAASSMSSVEEVTASQKELAAWTLLYDVAAYRSGLAVVILADNGSSVLQREEALWQQPLKAILHNWLMCLTPRKIYGEHGEGKWWLWWQFLLWIPGCAFGLNWENNRYAFNVRHDSIFKGKIPILWKFTASFQFV